MDHPLPDELLFEPDGHLTETALTCVADGELALVAATALGHLDGCDHCSHRLGEAALFSLAAGDALAAIVARPSAVVSVEALRVIQPSVAISPAGPSPTIATAGPRPFMAASSRPAEIAGPPRRARRPMPVAAIAAALLVAVMTTGSSLLDAARGAPGTIAGAVTAVPFLVRVAGSFLRADWGHGSLALLAVKCASALVLAAVGFQVARVTSRSGSWQQGGV